MYICCFAPSVITYTSPSDDSHANDVPDVPLLHPLPFPAKLNGPVRGSANSLFGMPPKGQQPFAFACLDPACSKSPWATRTRDREVDCDIRKLLCWLPSQSPSLASWCCALWKGWSQQLSHSSPGFLALLCQGDLVAAHRHGSIQHVWDGRL